MLSFIVHLLNGRYDAADPRDPARVEWPPHPARLFCALVATAKCDDEWNALRWLERQPPPSVHVAGLISTVQHESYVVANVRANKGGSQTHQARTNKLRSRVSGQPAAADIVFCWPVDASDAVANVLRELAFRVPYLGRSSGVAFTEVTTGPVPTTPLVYRPVELADADVQVRVPYPGYLDALEITFEAGRSAWEVARIRGYAVVRPAVASPPVLGGPFVDFLPLRFVDARPEGGLLLRYTTALREALMSRVSDPLPPQLHGHGVPNLPHVAFVGLPNVGNAHANGQLLGVGVALPEMPRGERRALLRALIPTLTEEPAWSLRVTGQRSDTDTAHVLWNPAAEQPRGATSERWVGPSEVWATATPLALDRHPKRSGDAEAIVARSCVLAGYPEPAEVIVGPEAHLTGAPWIHPRELPDWLRGRELRHVRLRFAERLRGPVLVGAGRYLGLGLLGPLGRAESAT